MKVSYMNADQYKFLNDLEMLIHSESIFRGHSHKFDKFY